MNPFQIGTITIGGASVALSTLVGPGKPSEVKTLLFDNAGSAMIYVGTQNMNLTTLAGVVLRIPAGESRVIGGIKELNMIDWRQFYVHGDNAGDILNVVGQTVS